MALGEKMNENSKEYWDSIWTLEGSKTWRQYPSTFTKIVEIIGDTQQKVLELGCGVGVLLERLQQKGHFLKGIDISDAAVYQVQKKGIPAESCKIPPIMEADNSYDWIVACEFLEHFADPDSVLEECVRVSNKAIFCVPDNILGSDECFEHEQKFSVKMFKEMLVRHYNHVRILGFTETFDSYQDRICLPTLLAICEVYP
jgi:ubiquinone/menaquinone biosynthesis C-methylase UbiE